MNNPVDPLSDPPARVKRARTPHRDVRLDDNGRPVWSLGTSEHGRSAGGPLKLGYHRASQRWYVYVHGRRHHLGYVDEPPVTILDRSGKR